MFRAEDALAAGLVSEVLPQDQGAGARQGDRNEIAEETSAGSVAG